MRPSFLKLLLVLLTIALAAGCSSTKKQAASGKSASGTDEQIFIGDTLEKNYDPNVIMKRAEAFFDKEDYAEALIEYQHFLDLHRIHQLASYAQFKVGMSHFKMARSIDRDPAPILKAHDAFQKLLKEFPGSKYHTEAVERIRACNSLMAQSYYFVGQFYYRRESYLAAAYRFEAIIKKFPDMDVAPDALYYLALAYDKLGAQDWAQEKLTLLALQYPGSKHEREGHRLLAQLNAKFPPNTALAKAASGPAIVASIPGSEPPPSPAPPSALASVPAPVSASAPQVARTPSSPPADAAAAKAVKSQGATLFPPVTICRIGSWC